ncbi:MAG TPA: GNAT family N-acetyltransferase [Actinomycetota bacterium]
MEFRTIEREEIDAFSAMLSNAFGDVKPEEHHLEADRATLEPDRTWVAIDDGRIVGGAGAYTMQTVLPGGGAVGTAGVTAVGVLPTHRRRGITTELLGRILGQARDRGEPIASLFASQAVIYGRFGFGLATQALEFDVQLDRVHFSAGTEASGTVRLLDREAALAPMYDVWRRFAPTRPGVNPGSERDFPWGFTEKKGEPFFYAIHEDDDGTADAFAVYRIVHKWPTALPHLHAKVRTLIATSPTASASIWRYLFDIDLVSRVTTGDRPLDDPLLWQLEEPRAARPRLYDALYVRPVDVVAALEGRPYAADGRLTIAVTDPFRPDDGGTFVIEVEDGHGSCARTDDEPDLVGSAHAIGSTYLGGATWSTLANAGRVEVREASALSRADAMFASSVAPWVPFMF